MPDEINAAFFLDLGLKIMVELLSPQETLLGCISEMLENITNSIKMLENGG